MCALCSLAEGGAQPENCKGHVSGAGTCLCSVGTNALVLHYEVPSIPGWICPHKIYAQPKPMNVTVFGNRSLPMESVKMWPCWVKVGSKIQCKWCSYKKRGIWTWRHTQREGGGRGWGDAAKERVRSPEAGRSKDLPPEAVEDAQPYQHLHCGLKLLASRTV